MPARVLAHHALVLTLGDLADAKVIGLGDAHPMRRTFRRNLTFEPNVGSPHCEFTGWNENQLHADGVHDLAQESPAVTSVLGGNSSFGRYNSWRLGLGLRLLDQGLVDNSGRRLPRVNDVPQAAVNIVRDESNGSVHHQCIHPSVVLAAGCCLLIRRPIRAARHSLPCDASAPRASCSLPQPTTSSDLSHELFGPESSPLSPCPKVMLPPIWPNAQTPRGSLKWIPARTSSTATRVEVPFVKSVNDSDLLIPATPLPHHWNAREFGSYT